MMAELATGTQMGATNAIPTFDSDDRGGGSIRGDSGKRAGGCGPNLQVQQHSFQRILHRVDLWSRSGDVRSHLEISPQRQGVPQIPSARLRLRRVQSGLRPEQEIAQQPIHLRQSCGDGLAIPAHLPRSGGARLSKPKAKPTYSPRLSAPASPWRSSARQAWRAARRPDARARGEGY